MDNNFRFPKDAHHPFNRVPSISCSKLINDDNSIDTEIFDSMREFGFFYVTNVSNYDAASELKYLNSFFALPTSTKMALAVKKHDSRNKNIYRGYGPVVENSGTQHKEMFNIGPHEVPTPSYKQTDSSLDKLRAISREQSVWPETGDVQFDEEFKKVFRLGVQIRIAIAQGKSGFSDMFLKTMHFCRVKI